MKSKHLFCPSLSLVTGFEGTYSGPSAIEKKTHGSFSNTRFSLEYTQKVKLCTILFASFCYRLVPIPIPTSNYKSEEQKAELAANLIQDTKGIGNYELIHSSLKHLLKDTTLVDEVHIS